MKETWLKDAVRNIKKRIVSWFSIVTIVLIGTSVIVGLYFCSDGLKKSAVSYIESQNYHDLDVVCSLGIKEDEIESIRELDGVKDAEGQISLPGLITDDGRKLGVTVISVTERISVPNVMEGRMPAASDECAINDEGLKKLDGKIGDEVELTLSSARFSDILVHKRFTITGVVGHPDYMARTTTNYVVLPASSFDTTDSAFDYSNALIDADLKQDPFSGKYGKAVAGIKEKVEAYTRTETDVRIAGMQKELDEEFQNAERKAGDQLAEGKKKIDDGQKEFDEKIAEAQKELDDAQAKISEGKEKAEKELADGAKKIKDGEEEYNKGIADGEKQLADAEAAMEKELADAKWKLFDGFLKIDETEKLLNEKELEYEAGRKRLEEGEARFHEITSQIDGILNDGLIRNRLLPFLEGLRDFSHDERDSAMAKACDDLREACNKDTVTRCQLVLRAYDDVFAFLTDEQKHDLDAMIGVDNYRGQLGELADARDQLERGNRKLEEGRQELDQGWFSLKQAKEKLAEGETELARKEPEARRQLADARTEFERRKEEGKKQLADARSKYNAGKAEAESQIAAYEEELEKGRAEFDKEKAKGEKELQDARAEYDKAEKEVRDKLAEIRDQIDKARETPCGWLIQTRDANASFVQNQSYITAIDSFFLAFTPLYAGIIIVVCFFTMAIIVEEQTKQIGTCKAFGMYHSEIMNKYVLFGATGAALGAVIGIGGAFGLEAIVTKTLRDQMIFPLGQNAHNILPVILMPAGIVLITCIAVVWSCRRVIRCSAVGLISGNEPVSPARKKKKSAAAGGIYIRLIISNLITDVGREVVSVVIIIVCIFLVGFGVDIKLAYNGALDRQMEEIWLYDISLTESENITDEEREKVKEAVKEYDTLYLPSFGGVIIDGDSELLTSGLCVDDAEAFGRFYSLKDAGGNGVQIPADGALVTEEMRERNGLTEGSTINLITGSLTNAGIAVRGKYMLHMGKMLIMTGDYYRECFDKEPVKNNYLIKVTDGDVKEIANRLSELPGVSNVERAGDLKERYRSVVDLYNAVVIIVIAFSVILSFMILLNLSNILVAHRMRELLTMRVNGFSNAQVTGYLVREVLATGILALVIALVVGIPLTDAAIRVIETDGFMFIRNPYAAAWTFAVAVNVLFSVVINALAFRKVRTVPLTDIT
ncbi:MAG: FtsX-like permease family protein, partial [Lachnospiraceae bacterium]|nr:FtsX-like permease family protein [Lachnospiraceae bacterium]